MKLKSEIEEVNELFRRTGFYGKESATMINVQLKTVMAVLLDGTSSVRAKHKKVIEDIRNTLRSELNARPKRKHIPKGRPAASGLLGKKVIK